MAKPAGDIARNSALRLLAGIRNGQRLSDQEQVLHGLSGPDQARALRLATTVLRHQSRADLVLAALMDRRAPPPVMEILRLGTVEMLELAEAPHGVVASLVTIARAGGKKTGAAAGLINAVLRRVAGTEGWGALPPQRLPDWLRTPMNKAWGKDVAPMIEAAHQAGAPIDLTLKPGATAPEQARVLPTGSYRLLRSAQVSALSGYAEGDWWVQDAAAALAVPMLRPEPGEHIADLCAAPGGKTLQLAAAGANVTAIDINEARLAQVAANLARAGLEARLIAADALAWEPDQPLDAVLLDAPCSATGTIRRHPDLPFLRDGSGVPALIALQSQLIDRALHLLPPGGRMVYAVCSLIPAEGETQIRAALGRHPRLMVEKPDLPGIAPEWITPEGGLRLRPDYWPDQGGMDGFFIARLRKPA